MRVEATLGAGSSGTVAKVLHKFTGEVWSYYNVLISTYREVNCAVQVFALKAIQQRLVKEKQLQEYVEREARRECRLFFVVL